MKVKYRILSYGKLFRVQFNCGLGWVDHRMVIDGGVRAVLFNSFEEAKEAVVTGGCQSWSIIEEGEQDENSGKGHDQHKSIGFYEDQETDGHSHQNQG